MTVHAYIFEAKHIQNYLTESGRLRDLVAGSELLEALTGPLLDAVLAAAGLSEPDDLRFSRRAGSALYAFADSEQVVGAFVALWSLTVQQFAPGLEYDHARGAGVDAAAAHRAARVGLHADRSRVVRMLPAAAPLAARSPRTGHAATATTGPDRERLDAHMVRKRQFDASARADSTWQGLVGRFSPPGSELTAAHWPRDLEPVSDDDSSAVFPFQRGSRTLALIHADGNDFGIILQRAQHVAAAKPDQFIEIFRALSEGVQHATERAVQDAVDQILTPVWRETGMMPARPIVLGGDDLSILVRADLALPFAKCFLTAFERESARALAQLGEKHGVDELPERLTAAAGMVYLRANQPFHLAAALAEDLTREAKAQARRVVDGPVVSSLLFHRVTATIVSDYQAILDTEFSSGGSSTFVSTLGSYALERGSALPALDDLLDLQVLLGEPVVARGATRQLLTLISLSRSQAESHYRRWRQIMKQHHPQELERFDSLLGRLLPGWHSGCVLPFVERGQEWVSPLSDALALLAVDNDVVAMEVR
ncbi:MAG: hypothetical protein JJU22_07755 [Gammaproteobacteria bacterium]|nr:hypothetical protein [Gammaproteobacteria bacterium]